MKRFVIALLFALTPLAAHAANEVVFNFNTTGSTLYFVDFNANGQAWDTTGTPAYETYTTARGDYDIALTEVSGTGLYRGSLPSSAGLHRYTIYLQAGGSPSATDDVAIAEGDVYFDLTDLGDAAIADALSGIDGGTVISPVVVDKNHTWMFANPERMTAANYVTEVIGFDGVLAMDFSEALKERQATILSVATPTVTALDAADDDEPAVSATTVSQSKKQVHMTFDADGSDAGSYTISVTVTTTDGYQITRKGRLVLESAN
jgi:hypothetical protein